MSVRSRLLHRVLWAVLIGLVAAIGVVAIQRSHTTADAADTATTGHSEFDGPVMPPHLRAANFRLTDQNGHPVSLSQYRGHVVVLTFIHSQCHDACPLMVQQIKGALNDLPGDGAGIPALGITVAPREDTVSSRRAFLAKMQMSRRLAFLNGPATSLRQVWKAYAIQPVTPKIDHSTFVMLIDKRGFERVGFPADQLTPEALAHDITTLKREKA
jgi:protein SCO1/2